MNEDIQHAIEVLQDLLKHNLDLGALQEQHSAVGADLEKTSAELESKSAALASATAGLTAAQVQAQKEHDEAIYNKQIELRNLSDRIKSAQSELDTKTSELNSASTRHDQVLTSLNALKVRLG